MSIRELKIAGSFEITPRQFADDRGVFLESFQSAALREATGRPFAVAQANTSVSRRGVLRGIHFADIPPSQAKYVTAPVGRVLDFVIDIRVGSPTFGAWDMVVLDDSDRRAIFIPEGLGHAFLALTDDAVVHYLVNAPFAPGREHGIAPLDAEIGLPVLDHVDDVVLSDKDAEAPGLAEAASAGLLPTWEDWLSYTATLTEERS